MVPGDVYKPFYFVFLSFRISVDCFSAVHDLILSDLQLI